MQELQPQGCWDHGAHGLGHTGWRTESLQHSLVQIEEGDKTGQEDFCAEEESIKIRIWSSQHEFEEEISEIHYYNSLFSALKIQSSFRYLSKAPAHLSVHHCLPPVLLLDLGSSPSICKAVMCKSDNSWKCGRLAFMWTLLLINVGVNNLIFLRITVFI